LGVAAADVKDGRIVCAGDGAAHLDVTDAVVHADEGEVPHEREGTCCECYGLERCAHARAFRVGYAGEGGGDQVSLGEGAFDEANDPLAVVERGVFREEASSCWRDVGMTKICEDVDRCGGVVVVLDYAYGEFVGRALKTKGDGHLGGVMVVYRQSRTMSD